MKHFCKYYLNYTKKLSTNKFFKSIQKTPRHKRNQRSEEINQKQQQQQQQQQQTNNKSNF